MAREVVRKTKLVFLLDDGGGLKRGYFIQRTSFQDDDGNEKAFADAEIEAQKSDLVSLFGAVANTDQEALRGQVDSLVKSYEKLQNEYADYRKATDKLLASVSKGAGKIKEFASEIEVALAPKGGVVSADEKPSA